MTDSIEVIGSPMTMYHPGAAGWPAEPKVSQAEELLYGEHAAVIRLLGEATVATQTAYSLACKRRQDLFTTNPEDEAAFDSIANDSWALYEQMRRTHRQLAERAITIVQRWESQNNSPLARPLQPLAPSEAV